MKRKQFLGIIGGVVASPFVAKEVLAKEETGTGLLHQIRSNPSILTDEIPYKNMGMMIPKEKIDGEMSPEEVLRIYKETGLLVWNRNKTKVEWIVIQP